MSNSNPQVLNQNVSLSNGIEIFYREAGEPKGPTILLIHGFPTSSFQYRKVIPILVSAGYHVLAPDLPGFGFTVVPPSLSYKYTFENFGKAVSEFLDIKKVSSFAVYIFDYGAPTAFHLIADPGARSQTVTAIISQNGNAYEEGLGDFWTNSGLRKFWSLAPGAADYDSARANVSANILTYDVTKWQYEYGTPPDHTVNIDPATYTLDYALMAAGNNKDVQLDIFYDYQTNLKYYPAWQQWLREKQPPLIAVWGKNDLIFVPPGAEAFKRDLPNAVVEFIDAGHFVVESNAVELSEKVIGFLKDNGI